MIIPWLEIIVFACACAIAFVAVPELRKAMKSNKRIQNAEKWSFTKKLKKYDYKRDGLSGRVYSAWLKEENDRRWIPRDPERK